MFNVYWIANKEQINEERSPFIEMEENPFKEWISFEKFENFGPDMIDIIHDCFYISLPNDMIVGFIE